MNKSNIFYIIYVKRSVRTAMRPRSALSRKPIAVFSDFLGFKRNPFASGQRAFPQRFNQPDRCCCAFRRIFNIFFLLRRWCQQKIRFLRIAIRAVQLCPVGLSASRIYHYAAVFPDQRRSFKSNAEIRGKICSRSATSLRSP